jgi:hypothetical protein
MKFSIALFLLTNTLLLTACSPHPASGVWKTTADNDYGINKIVVGFDGKANFATPKLDNATWHCFWSAASEQETVLNCTPSTNPDQEERFILSIKNKATAELRHNSQVITVLTLQDENPSPVN